MTVLVVDHGHSTRCGIRDLGVRIADRLGAVHVDCNSQEEYVAACYEHEATVVIVNYRADLMPWWHLTIFTELAVLHQYGPTTVDQRAAELLAAGFDHVLVLDPTVHPADPRVHAVGRPIPETVEDRRVRKYDVPYVGSFGFAFPHKGFEQVAAEISDQCETALYVLHMPEAFFNGAQGADLYTEGILAACREKITKPDVYIRHTSEHLAERELVARLATNTVNCLLYHPGQPEAGLSSALDYLIAARRPILVSEADMFRAAWNRPIWPNVRLNDILDDYDHFQKEADVLYESMDGQFARDVEQIVADL